MSNHEEHKEFAAHHDFHDFAVTPQQIDDMTDIGIGLAQIANEAHQDGRTKLHEAFVEKAGILIGRDTKGAKEIERRRAEQQYTKLLADTIKIFDEKDLYTHHEQYDGEAYSIATARLPLVGLRESECYIDMKLTKIEAAGELVEMQFERTTLPMESDADYHAVTLNTDGLYMFLNRNRQEVVLPAEYCDSSYLFVQMKSDEELIKLLYGELESRKR